MMMRVMLKCKCVIQLQCLSVLLLRYPCTMGGVVSMGVFHICICCALLTCWIAFLCCGCALCAVGKELACAIGIMKLSGADVKKINKGVAIEPYTYLNDGLWLTPEFE